MKGNFWRMVTQKRLKTFALSLCLLVILCYLYIKPNDARKVEARPLPSGTRKWLIYLTEKMNGPSIAMNDSRLVQEVREKFLLPPPSSRNYRLEQPNIVDPSMGQGDQIRSILGSKRKNGFFVECGALDGETRSNTLYFERFLNWTGLLIEPDPINFSNLVTRNRRAWLSPSCVSPHMYPSVISLKLGNNVSQLDKNKTGLNVPGYVDIQCIPFYTYLLALNRTSIDYFSLDIEGFELDVVETIPFDKIDIKTLSVEFIHVPRGKKKLREFMEGKGYMVHSEVTRGNSLANDFIFVKRN